MGKITVFTSRDILSQRVRMALEKREIPFDEIRLDTTHPERWQDLHALTNSYAVPALFVNNQFIGGVKETIRELRNWDKDDRYACALEKYEMEIAGRPFDDVLPQLVLLKEEEEEEEPEKPSNLGLLQPPSSILLPDKTTLTTFHDVTETLRSILTLSDMVYKGTQYRNCFSGQLLVEAVGVSMRLTLDQAVTYCNSLIQWRVVVPAAAPSSSLSSNTSRKETISSSCPKFPYRLQCYATPHILNSYKICSSSSSTELDNVSKMSALDVVNILDSFLTDLEVNALNSRGKVDYSTLVLSDLYPVLEEAVCALQLVDVEALNQEERLAFALNLFRLMMRYAFCKVGFVANEEDRIHFFKTVSFNVGGMVFSFQEWIDGILRANQPRRNGSTLLSSIGSRGGGSGGAGGGGSMNKQRRRLSLTKLDWRVHLAAYCDPLFGCRVSLPFRTFSAAHIDAELEAACQVYLSQPSVVSVDADRQLVKLSRVFQWYRNDVAPNRKSLIARLSDYVSDPASLENVTKIKYTDIPWTTNAMSYARYTRDSVVGQVTAVGYMLMGRFKPPPTPCNEKLRVATLRSLNLLDTTTSDERINRITNQCQAELKAPIVCVSLIDSTRQWFKSTSWECSIPPVPGSPRDVSFCGHTVAGPPTDVFIVENAVEDDRFADHPFVAGDFAARFYAGVPLSFPSGGGILVNIGTLCLIDFQPRQLTTCEVERLCHYASLVKKEILRLDDGSTDLCSRCSLSSLDSDDSGDENEFESLEENGNVDPDERY